MYIQCVSTSWSKKKGNLFHSLWQNSCSSSLGHRRGNVGKCFFFFCLHYILHPPLISSRIKLLPHLPSPPGPVWKPADPAGVRAGCAAGAAGDRAAGPGSGEQLAASSLPEGTSQVLGTHWMLRLLSHTGVVSALPTSSRIPLSSSNILAPVSWDLSLSVEELPAGAHIELECLMIFLPQDVVLNQ